MPQSELVLRKLDDLLKNDKVTPEMEQQTGMSRGEMEQFVKKFQKPKDAAAGPGRELTVKPGQAQPGVAGSNVPALDPKTSFNRRSTVSTKGLPQDAVQGNVQGARSQAPLELRSRVQAYRNSLSRPTAPARATAAPQGGGR
jgi:hypothetical protein